MWASSQIPVSPCVMRPRFSTAVASTNTMPAPPWANLPRWTRCQSVTSPSRAEYWHIGETTMRLRSSTSRIFSLSNNMRFRLPGRALERHGGGGAFAFPLLLVDHLAGVLEEDLEQLRFLEAAKMHLDLVLLDALAHVVRILREKRDVVDRARAGRALRMLLQQERVADLVRFLRGEVHADVLPQLQPVAGKAEIRPLGEPHAEHLLVELLRALQVLRYHQVVIQSGKGHGGSCVFR